jgi:hypothetical protein
MDDELLKMQRRADCLRKLEWRNSRAILENNGKREMIKSYQKIFGKEIFI